MKVERGDGGIVECLDCGAREKWERESSESVGHD